MVLSGPEPQRSYLEQFLLEQALTLPYKIVLAKGKPHSMEHRFVAENVEVISYLRSEELQDLLRRCDAVVWIKPVDLRYIPLITSLLSLY